MVLTHEDRYRFFMKPASIIKRASRHLNREKIISYMILMRLDRPIGIWLLLLPGWWAILLAAGGPMMMNVHDWRVFLLFGLGAVLMRGAGCVINDLWDRKLDRFVARTKNRPLASGQIKPIEALAFLFFLLSAALLILLQFNLVTVLLGFITAPLIALYPLMKRITWWPQAFLGLTFNFGALMGWSAVTGAVQLPALLLYGGGLFWTLGYDTIYAHQDIEDDLSAGIRSTALKFGANGKIWVAGFYLLAMILIANAAFQAAPRVMTFVCLLPAFAHLIWQSIAWRLNDPASALRVFKSNREAGWLIMLGLSLALLF